MMSDQFRAQMSSQQPLQQQQQHIPPQFSQQQQQPPQSQMMSSQQQQQPSSGPPFPSQMMPGGPPPPQQPISMQNQPPYGSMQGIPNQPQQMHPGGLQSMGGMGMGQQSSGMGIGGPGAMAGGQQSGQTGGGVDGNLFHPITRAKALMVDLKQALQILMKSAADVTKEQAIKDAAPPPSNDDTPPPASTAADTEEFRRAFETFDAICDQIESNFLMIQDLHREQQISDRYTPANVLLSGQKTDDQSQMTGDFVPGRPFLTYKEYEELARIQSNFASTVRESFAECSRLLE